MITELGLLGQHQIKELETEFNHMASDIVDYMQTTKPPQKNPENKQTNKINRIAKVNSD